MLTYTKDRARHLFIVEEKGKEPDVIRGIDALTEKIGTHSFDAEELYKTGRTVTKDHEITIVMRDNDVLSVVEFEEGEG
jgi:hypothetical protein